MASVSTRDIVSIILLAACIRLHQGVWAACDSNGRSCCNGNSGIGLPCAEGRGACIKKHYGSTCIYCGHQNEPCCPGSRPGDGCELVHGYYDSADVNVSVCVGTGRGLGLKCLACGKGGQPCCPGSSLNERCDFANKPSACRDGQLGVCAGPTDNLTCIDVGYDDQPCSPEAVFGDPCNYDYEHLAQTGNCVGSSSATGLDLTCKLCGMVGAFCCPAFPYVSGSGSKPGDPCLGGVCLNRPGGLRCVACGGKGEPCCPGSKVGDACAGGVCVGKNPPSNTGLQCLPCGHRGLACCSGSTPGQVCDQFDGYTYHCRQTVNDPANLVCGKCGGAGEPSCTVA